MNTRPTTKHKILICTLKAIRKRNPDLPCPPQYSIPYLDVEVKKPCDVECRELSLQMDFTFQYKTS